MLPGAPSQTGCPSRPRSSLREGNWDHWFPGDHGGGIGPRLSKGIEVEEEVTPDSATVRCVDARLLRLRTGIHTFELLSAGPWGGT